MLYTKIVQTFKGYITNNDAILIAIYDEPMICLHHSSCPVCGTTLLLFIMIKRQRYIANNIYPVRQ